MKNSGKKIYFASDVHLGMYPVDESKKRELIFVSWLDSIKSDARELWLMGDIFDYWFEYRKVIPRGYSRFLGKLAELSDSGIQIHMFPGNHDVWLFSYFEEEIGAIIHHNHLVIEMGSKTFYLAHGDGLNKSDFTYKFIRSLFGSKFLQWCYARLHPNASASFAQWWSKKSRYSREMTDPYKGDDKEEQMLFAKKYLESNPEIDFFIFGHRHLAFDKEIENNSRLICLGDWIYNFTYGVFDGEEFKLERFK